MWRGWGSGGLAGQTFPASLRLALGGCLHGGGGGDDIESRWLSLVVSVSMADGGFWSQGAGSKQGKNVLFLTPHMLGLM